jgi:glutamine synthetase
MDAEQVQRRVEEQGIELVRLDYVDWSGLLRGRTVSRDHLASAFQGGINSAQTNITITVDDHESDPALGAQSGDFWFMPDAATFAPLPWRTTYGHMFVNVVNADGSAWFGDPRALLRRLAEQAGRELGVVRLGFEQEGHLIRREGDRYVKAFNTRFFLADFQEELPEFFVEMAQALRAFDTPMEKFTVEGPHGMLELNARYDDALPSADKHVRFKLAFRAIARRQGYIGSFIPKPFEDVPGAGCHVHISLADPRSGGDLLGDDRDPRGLGLSPLGYAFLAGLLAHADALCAIGSPTVNSYKRLQPGMWAPAFKGYGLGNRSAMIRVVQRRPGVAGPARLELRCPDGAANSYFLGAAIIACGLDGVRRQLDPGEPSEVDFGHLHEESERAAFLPRSLDRALDALEADGALREAFGARLLDGYLKVKRHEWSAFCHAVTDWELRTYLEYF